MNERLILENQLAIMQALAALLPQCWRALAERVDETEAYIEWRYTRAGGHRREIEILEPDIPESER